MNIKAMCVVVGAVILASGCAGRPSCSERYADGYLREQCEMEGMRRNRETSQLMMNLGGQMVRDSYTQPQSYYGVGSSAPSVSGGFVTQCY